MANLVTPEFALSGLIAQLQAQDQRITQLTQQAAEQVQGLKEKVKELQSKISRYEESSDIGSGAASSSTLQILNSPNMQPEKNKNIRALGRGHLLREKPIVDMSSASASLNNIYDLDKGGVGVGVAMSIGKDDASVSVRAALVAAPAHHHAAASVRVYRGSNSEVGSSSTQSALQKAFTAARDKGFPAAIGKLKDLNNDLLYLLMEVLNMPTNYKSQEGKWVVFTKWLFGEPLQGDGFRSTAYFWQITTGSA